MNAHMYGTFTQYDYILNEVGWRKLFCDAHKWNLINVYAKGIGWSLHRIVYLMFDPLSFGFNWRDKRRIF